LGGAAALCTAPCTCTLAPEQHGLRHKLPGRLRTPGHGCACRARGWLARAPPGRAVPLSAAGPGVGALPRVPACPLGPPCALCSTGSAHAPGGTAGAGRTGIPTWAFELPASAWEVSVALTMHCHSACAALAVHALLDWAAPLARDTQALCGIRGGRPPLHAGSLLGRAALHASPPSTRAPQSPARQQPPRSGHCSHP